MGESYVLKASFLNSSSFTRVTLLEQPSLVNKQEKKKKKMFPGFGWSETRRSKFEPIFSDKVH